MWDNSLASKQASVNNAQRNASIELLRIISTAMVLVLHVVLTTKLQDIYSSGIHFYVYWWLEALSVIAVDVFFIISGYFMCESKFKAKNVFRIAIGGVWLYSVVFSIVNNLISGTGFPKMDLLKMLFPVYTHKFWFVNAYLIIYILSPFINKMLAALNKKQHTAIMIVCLLLFCARHTFSMTQWIGESSGGAILFFMLYIVASWIRKYYRKDNKPAKFFFAYIALSLLIVLSARIIIAVGLGSEYAGKFYGYSSVLVVAEAFALFLAFLNIKPIAGKTGRFINFVAKHSFSVYIIHFAMMGVIFTNILHVDRFVDNVATGVPAIFAAVIIVYVFCTLVDIAKTSFFGVVGKLIKNTGPVKLYYRLMDKWDNAVN